MPAKSNRRGELTEIIIGTVVAAEDEGINARGLYDKLIEWGHKTTLSAVNARLQVLANEGRIDRKWAGVYVGPGRGPDHVPGYHGRKNRPPAREE
jgi:hypothetical protein